MAFAGLLGKEHALGNLQLKTDRANTLTPVWYLDKSPVHPFPIICESRGQKKKTPLFTAQLNSAEARLEIDWNSPVNETKTENPTLPIDRDIIIADDFLKPSGQSRLKAGD